MKPGRIGALAALLLLTAQAPSPPAGTETGSTAGSPHRGGTLRLTADAGAGTVDPQVNYNSEMIQVQVAVYDGLLAFAKADAQDGARIVPDLAEAIPQPEDGGRTYVFHLRSGIRFSDGREVTVDDVVASFRRLFKVHAPTAGGFYGNIVGADACLKDAEHCTLAGGVNGDAAARTVTFHLTQPDAEFADKIAFPQAYILPADTAPRDLGNDAAPGTGPYRIVSYDPNRAMRLERNPYFRPWSAEAQPDGYVDHIVYSFGLTDEAEVTAVENGDYDWMYDDIPLDRYAELGDRFADRVRITDVFATYYIPMNVRLAPFNDVRVRRAINYAVNRRSIQTYFGGPATATILCQNVPRGLPGFEPSCPYTKGADIDHPAPDWSAPDLARARALVAESGTKGMHVTLVVADRAVDMAMGTYLQNVLRKLGYDADVKPISFALQFNYIQNTNNKVQISLSDWYADYPSASDFLTAIFGCENFHPGSDSSVNIAGYCNQETEDVLNKAELTSVTDPKAGAALWAKADRMILNDAPSAPLIQIKKIEIHAKRVGNFMSSTVYHFLFSRAWVQ